MNTKGTEVGEDRIDLQRVMLEKAMAGHMPVKLGFHESIINADGGWIPVNWIDSPSLEAIKFSDGSIYNLPSHEADRRESLDRIDHMDFDELDAVDIPDAPDTDGDSDGDQQSDVTHDGTGTEPDYSDPAKEPAADGVKDSISKLFGAK